MIAFNHVSQTYEGKWHALRDVHFRMEKGEFAFLTGPSGAGKSTVLKLLYMDERPGRGEVLISFGQNLSFHSGERSFARIQLLRRKIGIVFQDFRLLPDRSLFENVAFALRVTGVPEARVKQRVFEVLARTGIVHKAMNRPHQLSGGEQQRAAIARALAAEPFLILADEPTGNLDDGTADEILEIFREINASGTAVLLATHDRGLLRSLPYRKLHLERGVLVDRDI